MRKIVLLSILMFWWMVGYSQNKNLSIGFQSTFPTKGFSLRYDLDSVNQYQLSYTIFKDNSLDRTLYGGKYSRIINRFKYFQSYTYVGFMIMNYSQQGIPTNYGNEKSGTTFSYGLGLGIQNTLFHRLNLSLEGGDFQSGYNAGYSFGKSFWGAFAVIGVYLTFAAKTAI